MADPRANPTGPPQLGVDWSRADDVLAAWTPCLPQIDVLQLTVEQAFAPDLPVAFTAPLDRAAASGDVVGHAVMGAPFTFPRDRVTVDWLARTRHVLRRWPVRWLIDHVGCCRANGWNAAPVPLPASQALVDHVVEHLRWAGGELGVPMGLENLALAVSREDVWAQPDLLEAMLAPVDGVLLLDVHNLWCQAVNYALDPITLLDRYPLERVRQLHVAGGRWEEHPAGRLRRDTHDDAVPREVFALVPEVIARCPSLEVAVVERMGGTLTPSDRLEDDLRRLAASLTPTHQPRPREHVPSPLRVEHPSMQHGLFAALRADDRAAVERLAPGWWKDDRSWQAAVELTTRWGRSVPS